MTILRGNSSARAWRLVFACACACGGGSATPAANIADVSAATAAEAGTLEAGPSPSYTLTGEVGKVAGTGNDCHATSDGRPEGRCYGYLCGTNSNSIKAALSKDSPCGTDAEVWLICDGSGEREATRCARIHALDADPRAGTRSCIRENPDLHPFGEACVNCFLDAVDCARNNCLSECLAGDSLVCDQCQQDHGCTPAFFACSGLPNPK